VTPSWLEHQAQLLLADVKESVCRVNDVHFVEADNETVPAVTYEVRVHQRGGLQHPAPSQQLTVTH
jgi:hypothetical protein